MNKTEIFKKYNIDEKAFAFTLSEGSTTYRLAYKNKVPVAGMTIKTDTAATTEIFYDFSPPDSYIKDTLNFIGILYVSDVAKKPLLDIHKRLVKRLMLTTKGVTEDDLYII